VKRTPEQEARLAALRRQRADDTLALVRRSPPVRGMATEPNPLPKRDLVLAASRELVWLAERPMPVVQVDAVRQCAPAFAGVGLAAPFSRPTIAVSYKTRFYLSKPAATARQLEVWLVYCAVSAEVVPVPNPRAMVPLGIRGPAAPAAALAPSGPAPPAPARAPRRRAARAQPKRTPARRPRGR